MDPYTRLAGMTIEDLSRPKRRGRVPLDRPVSARLLAPDAAFFAWLARQSVVEEMPIRPSISSPSLLRRSLARYLTALARSLDPTLPVAPVAAEPGT